MTARDAIHAMLPILDSPAEADTRAAELDRRLAALVAEARAEALHEAADFVDNDDTCVCGGCDTCQPRKLANGLREKAQGKASHVPGFFQAGVSYRSGDRWRFECQDVRPIRAIGRIHDAHTGDWHPADLGAFDWTHSTWTEETP